MAKQSLQEALSQVAGSQGRESKAPAKGAVPETNKGPGRGGKKVISGWFDPAVSRQLKQLGLELDDRPVQDLLGEALNLLFQKHRKPPIA